MKVLIGFEVHQQLATERKLFCNCPTNYRDSPPNRNVCPICAGFPGSKPLPPNARAVDAAIELALMLGCKIVVDDQIFIQRKHYDYPDLPSGYQRTSLPIGVSGELCGVRIREVHLEEDPGQYDPTLGSVDFNRSGVPLVEIVTEPDIHSGEEAREFLKSLVRVLEYSGKVRPEAGGAMRADTNISIEGSGRVEIKNINSIHGAYHAIKFELIRQAAKLKRGEQVTRETRTFLESQRVTTPMRTKEMEEDYRFIPDPDIFPLVISRDKVREMEKRMPEPPHLRKQRLIQQYGVLDDDAEVLVSEQALADLFERVAKQVDPKLTAKWFRTKLKKVLNYMGIGAEDVKFTPEQLMGVLRLVEGKKITPEQGEFLLRELARSPASPEELMRRLKLGELIPEMELDKMVEKIIRENPKVIQDYLSGRSEALNFLTGKVMKLAGGKADPRKIMELLRSKVGSP